MLVRIGYDLAFELPVPGSMLLMLSTFPDRDADLREPEYIRIEPAHAQRAFIDSFGNRAIRVDLPVGPVRFWYDNVIEDSGLHEPTIDGARLHPLSELPNDCLQYMMSSRYCEVDRLSQAAWDLFGGTPATSERAGAVMDWVHGNVEFGYQHARSTKTAADVFEERKGVCRDFQHLAITLMRALNIPAGYATGYLGDIGVPPVPLPMDFSAWLEVYLGGRWYALDARHNQPRVARILMARGRDATDVALTTSFGPANLKKFVVWTDEISDPAALAPHPEALEIEPAALPLATRSGQLSIA